MANEDDHILRLESKLDSIVDKIGDIDVTLVKQSVILEEHIRRTELLEAKVEPIEKHSHMISGAIKLIGLVVAGVATIEGLLRILRG